jgi:lipid-A-disaccharide synthase
VVTHVPQAGGFGLVAGEASGDNLGGPLIEALAARAPGSSFYGIAGPRMVAAGCEAWFPVDELSVMGLAEILRHLPRLLALRRSVIERLAAARPDAFVGIDSPEFNLRVAREMKARGVPAIQYVSPQVWAWRQGRVRTIGQSVDLVLCVLPFEVEFYRAHDVRAEFVGHPLADHLPLESGKDAAVAALALPQGGPVVAVLPGSRMSEVTRLGPPFAGTIAWLARQSKDAVFVAPMASPKVRAEFEAALAQHAPGARVTLVDGRTHECLAASDVVLLASGTATLEATLVKRPMVVAYRVAPLTNWLLRGLGLFKADFFSLPNLLAGRELVPELFQHDVRPEVLGPAVLAQLERPDRAELQAEFAAIHHRLRQGASERAAEAILDLVGTRRVRA